MSTALSGTAPASPASITAVVSGFGGNAIGVALNGPAACKSLPPRRIPTAYATSAEPGTRKSPAAIRGATDPPCKQRALSGAPMRKVPCFRRRAALRQTQLGPAETSQRRRRRPERGRFLAPGSTAGKPAVLSVDASGLHSAVMGAGRLGAGPAQAPSGRASGAWGRGVVCSWGIGSQAERGSLWALFLYANVSSCRVSAWHYFNASKQVMQP